MLILLRPRQPRAGHGDTLSLLGPGHLDGELFRIQGHGKIVEQHRNFYRVSEEQGTFEADRGGTILTRFEVAVIVEDLLLTAAEFKGQVTDLALFPEKSLAVQHPLVESIG